MSGVVGLALENQGSRSCTATTCILCDPEVVADISCKSAKSTLPVQSQEGNLHP